MRSTQIPPEVVVLMHSKNTHVKYLDIKIYPGKGWCDGPDGDKSRTIPTWDPGQHALSVTNAPAFIIDLVQPRQAGAPRVVVDLGCGNRPAAMVLAERGPTRADHQRPGTGAMIEAAHSP